MGANALRSGALSDQRVISLVNEQFVPVWIDVRKQALPPLPFDGEFLVRTELDEDRHVDDLFSQGFFLRSLVVSPDGKRLLNPQGSTVDRSVQSFRKQGYFSYAQVKAGDYLKMLGGALERWKSGPDVTTRR